MITATLNLPPFVSNLSALSSDRLVYLFISHFLLFSPTLITLGDPDRTPARCRPGDKKHKNPAAVFSVRPVCSDEQPPRVPAVISA